MELTEHNVWLYSNGGEDGRKAIRLLKENGIPFSNMGPVGLGEEEETPFIIFDCHWRFERVEDFIQSFHDGHLVQLRKLFEEFRQKKFRQMVRRAS